LDGCSGGRGEGGYSGDRVMEILDEERKGGMIEGI